MPRKSKICALSLKQSKLSITELLDPNNIKSHPISGSYRIFRKLGVDRVCGALAEGHTAMEICRTLGVTSNSYFKWRKGLSTTEREMVDYSGYLCLLERREVLLNTISGHLNMGLSYDVAPIGGTADEWQMEVAKLEADIDHVRARTKHLSVKPLLDLYKTVVRQIISYEKAKELRDTTNRTPNVVNNTQIVIGGSGGGGFVPPKLPDIDGEDPLC